MNDFKEGQDNIKAIWYVDGSCVKVADNGVDKISVIIENGQMAGVPWFGVWNKGVLKSKHNGAHIACVEFFQTMEEG